MLPIHSHSNVLCLHKPSFYWPRWRRLGMMHDVLQSHDCPDSQAPAEVSCQPIIMRDDSSWTVALPPVSILYFLRRNGTGGSNQSGADSGMIARCTDQPIQTASLPTRFGSISPILKKLRSTQDSFTYLFPFFPSLSSFPFSAENDGEKE